MRKYALSMVINGKAVELEVEPTATLVNVLRDQLGLTGTKKGCEQGDCGACTIIMNGKTVNSCLVLALQAQGKHILTIEGLGTAEHLHPLQEAFIEQGAVQCGYCTPGMLLSAKALLDRNPRPQREDIKEALAGNLCRCTGYLQIIEAVEAAASKIA